MMDRFCGIFLPLQGDDETRNLSSTDELSSAYEEISRGWEQTLFSNWMWNPVGWVQWPHHGLREHNRRIGESKAILENMYLNELNSRPDIVGQLVAQF
jgi:hypothetical protein